MKLPEKPIHVGIIMDGNRRAAKEKGLKILLGHTAGKEKVKECVRWCKKAGIKHLTLFAFSSENWERPQNQVNDLMNLFRHALRYETDSLISEGAKIRFVGERHRLASDLRERMECLERETQSFAAIEVVFALSYGARAEILAAARKFSLAGKTDFTEEDFSAALWTAGTPHPDLIIRPGGEMRLSNFLLWQAAYSELFFTKTLWPDFTEEEFHSILAEYARRERRNGK